MSALASGANSGSVIETRDLEKSYRTFRGQIVPALRGVSLEVRPGSIYGLIGQNGAGKTTLIKILLGLATPTGGEAKLLGGAPGDPVSRRRVGYLPEQMRIPDYFKATDFVRYMGRLNGVPTNDLKLRVPQLLQGVGLVGVEKPVSSYSKGMQQRLGLAQALVNDPELLFLDEPTDGLDPLGRKDVRDLLISLKAKGKTIFLNSHLLSEVELVCDQIVILHQGRVARTATPAEFLSGTGEYLIRVATVDPAVVALVDEFMNPATWEQTTLRCKPRDRAHLNGLIDRLRSVPVEIESVEPVKLSLEQFFLQVLGEKEA